MVPVGDNKRVENEAGGKETVKPENVSAEMKKLHKNISFLKSSGRTNEEL